MRPARLEIQGFTCYREKQSIDFSPLRLFAIAGPTGSGKSSMLDAITFALYGQVPRMGKQNLDEFISLGASRASILLDFQLRGKVYRVFRSMSRSGPKRAQLEEITDGVEHPVADGVREVDERIGELLALDYEAFTQSVLLPQGEFAKFLKSDPKQQRQIVRDLLRLGVYEEMRKRAAERERELSVSIERVQGLLSGPYLDATRENLETTEGALRDLQTRKGVKANEVQQNAERLQQVRSQWELIKERQDRQIEQQQLDRERPKVDSMRGALQRSERARQTLPAIEAVNAAVLELARSRDELAASNRQIEYANAGLQSETAALSAAQDKAKDLPALRSRVVQLAGLAPVAAERKACLLRIERIQADLKEAGKKARQEETRKATAQSKISELQQQITENRQSQAALSYDEARHTSYRSLQRQAIDLEHARVALQEAQQGYNKARIHLQQAEEDLHFFESESQSKQEALALATAELRAAERALDEARHANMASSLRLRLHAGEVCPVCEQTVSEPPLSAISVDIESAERALGATRKKERNAAASKEKANSGAITAHSARDAAEQSEKHATATLEQCKSRFEALFQSIEHAILPLECPQEVLVEQFIAGEIALLDARARQAAGIQQELNRLQLEQHTASSDLNAAVQALSGLDQMEAGLRRDIGEAQERVREIDTQIQLAAADDPVRESSQVQNQIDAVEKLVREATESYTKAQVGAQEAQRNVAASQARLRSAEDRRRDAAHVQESVLTETGFPDAESARSALLEPEAMRTAQSKVDTFDSRLDRVQNRIKELDQKLAGITVTEDQVAAADREWKQARREFDDLIGGLGKLEERLAKVRTSLEEAERLRAELARDKQCHMVYQQLATDLKTDHFQQYLLDGTFRKLVAGASARLLQLNDRYELAYTNGQFAVLDHDHGRQPRLADTLSGGETFLVSLALALELSDQIQEAAGAVRLDSLFIDEGFGTLDPETLDTVADAIETLGKSDRLVGIITHVPELHRRLPRLEVKPTPQGSCVDFVDD